MQIILDILSRAIDESAIGRRSKPSWGTCVLPSCSTRGVHVFFAFPENELIRSKWLKVCRLKNIGKYGKLCTKHFVNEDFAHNLALNEDAVPSKHLELTSKDSESDESENDYKRYKCLNESALVSNP